MRPLFTEEVARELGYQKYWPELHDWVFATIACLLGGFLLTGILIVGVMLIKSNF